MTLQTSDVKESACYAIYPYRVLSGDVEKTRSTATPIMIVSPEKILLSMTCNLSWCSCLDKIP